MTDRLDETGSARSMRGQRLRAFGQAAIDIVCWAVSIIVAEILRYDLSVARIQWTPTLALAGVTAAAWVVFAWIGKLYRHRYVYGSFEETRAVAIVSLGTAVVISVPAMTFGAHVGLPRSAPPIAFLLALVLMLCVRYVLRLVGERRALKLAEREPVVVFGAGFLGGTIVRRLLTDESSPYRPVALLDDDPLKKNIRIRNVDVIGTLDDLPAVVEKTGARVLIVAITDVDASFARRVASVTEPLGLDVKMVPSLGRLLDGTQSPIDLRDLSIEDIVGRRPVETGVESTAKYLVGKRVLVTGAGGSIGQELCAQIHRFNPAELIMLDRDETALQAVDMKVFDTGLLNTPETVLADIRDSEALREIFEDRRPDVVFHAAALKHLPMLQRFPEEAWKTNVLGTLNVLRAAKAVGVRTFVNISTDKAAEPTSVLGYSKRLAERLTASMVNGTGARYLSVRFGNVLGSRGSMVPIFTQMIEQGGPVTVTDPEVDRYFMTIPEACELVLQAGGIGRPGEVLILDMGRPVKIYDIARRMIAMSGRKNVQIIFTGLRPGEKLHEDLVSEDEDAERPFSPLISHAHVEPVQPEDLDHDRWLAHVMGAVGAR